MALAAGAGIRAQALGQRELKGFGDNVELSVCSGPDLRAAQPR
jgi:hypothetical protein